MATTHKTLKVWIARQAACVQHMIDAGDAQGAGYIARLLARDAYKLNPKLCDRHTMHPVHHSHCGCHE